MPGSSRSAKPPFLASNFDELGTGPPVFTASGGPTPRLLPNQPTPGLGLPSRCLLSGWFAARQTRSAFAWKKQKPRAGDGGQAHESHHRGESRVERDPQKWASGGIMRACDPCCCHSCPDQAGYSSLAALGKGPFAGSSWPVKPPFLASNFDEWHGTASFYRVWRSHLFFANSHRQSWSAIALVERLALGNLTRWFAQRRLALSKQVPDPWAA